MPGLRIKEPFYKNDEKAEKCLQLKDSVTTHRCYDYQEVAYAFPMIIQTHVAERRKTERMKSGTLWQSPRRTGDSEKLKQKGKLPFRMMKNHETPGCKYFYFQIREAQIL